MDVYFMVDNNKGRIKRLKTVEEDCLVTNAGIFKSFTVTPEGGEFDSVILQWNPRLSDVQVEKEREKSFATWLRYRDNEEEEVDPNALDDHVVEREMESNEEEEWTDEEDEDDAELDISLAFDDEYR
ncbi:hypothetical protein Taro_039421 [Colocasia esculenta]|uniref:Uncharacterized protein n=1 Tax=Colocasia esculenta TaxID=4460 RepID=A0A843W6D1_COLES|nr:hypothetical protein [Colocasia esculenta]